MPRAIPAGPDSTIANRIAILGPDAVSFARTWRLRVIRHPRQAYSVRGRKNRRGARVENGWWLWQNVFPILRERGLHKNKGRTWQRISVRCGSRVLVAAAASSAIGIRQRADNRRRVRKRA